MKTSRYKLLLVGAALLAAPGARAQVPPLEPLNAEARYDVTFNGLTLGRIRVSYHETAFGYKIDVDTETHGIAAIVKSEHTDTVAEGTLRDGQYAPTRFEFKGDKQRHATLAFDGEGHITGSSRTPQDDPKWRPPVPAEALAGVVDPATGFFVARRQLHDAMDSGGKEVTVRTYDAAHLTDLNVRAVSPADLVIMGKPQRAINLVIARKPVDGYTEKEKKRYAAGDPPIHFYLSADGRFFPLKVEAGMKWGVLSAELTELK
ncbi:MAG: DUF3108 domain-containing protein [Alphaproteobacteria bacterium]